MHLTWKEEHLDILLVPAGLLIMFGYHLYLLFRYLRCPGETVIGYENHNKKAWVERMMLVEGKDRTVAVNVINSNLSVSTTMCSMSLALCSLIGAWFGSSFKNILTSGVIYGDTSSTIVSIKYIALLSCFLVAFGAFVQAARYYVHASFLITTPKSDLPVKYIVRAVIRGGNFFSAGTRALYFATNLLMWIFGPIPMFCASVAMVTLLYNLDKNSCELHEYCPLPNQDSFKKIGEQVKTYQEVITVAQNNGDHGRQYENLTCKE